MYTFEEESTSEPHHHAVHHRVVTNGRIPPFCLHFPLTGILNKSM
jgi:hypothetical protein